MRKRAEEMKWTIEEGIEQCADMEKGEKHMTENYTAKIGTIRPCHECGVPVDVITYGSYMLDQMSIASCPKHDYEFKKSNCTSETCPVHGGDSGFDEEEYEKESKELHRVILTIREAIKEIKPRNDSILEYDRVKHVVEHGKFAHGRPDSFEFWFFREFVDYLGLNNKLSKISL